MVQIDPGAATHFQQACYHYIELVICSEKSTTSTTLSAVDKVNELEDIT